ncbi:MAG: hypothetical protein ABL962_14795 [Fimbriimonadaceae bacterium]
MNNNNLEKRIQVGNCTAAIFTNEVETATGKVPMRNVVLQQYERVWAVCRSRGFSHLSSYIRFVALDQDLVLQQKVHEIHRHLVGEPKVERRKKPLGDMPRNF